MTPEKNEKALLQKLGIDALNDMQVAARKTIKQSDEVLLLSATGTGKTLAFLLPVLELLDPEVNKIQVLIIVPARELALQIEQVVRNMGTGYKVNAFYGGRAGGKDKIDLNHPPAILIGTPGRIASHLQRGTFDITGIETLILDEFDKSLEIGFDDEMIEIIETLPYLTKKILTSATHGVEIPDFVEFEKPEVVDFTENQENNLTLDLVKIEESADDTLINLLKHIKPGQGIIFCNYKETIQEVSDILTENGIIHATFHGGIEQRDRERALIRFRNGSVHILIATDLASRGLDIPDLQFIIHFQLPHHKEAFVHRNGRTARMRKNGNAYVLVKNTEHLPDYIPEKPALTLIPNQPHFEPPFATVFVSGGRKDKISKGDLVGFFVKEGGLENAEIGNIELKRDCAFVAVARNQADRVSKKLSNRRLKKKKVRVYEI